MQNISLIDRVNMGDTSSSSWILFYIVLQATLIISAQSTDKCHCSNGTVGDCSCYCHLETSLLSSDGNRENLTRSFFPIESTPAEFVVIKYKYEGNSTSKTWYWGARSSYFLQPFEVFQYTSLFFGGSTIEHRLHTLELTLAPECERLEPSNENMKTLTLRLKLYAESPSSLKKIRVTDSYHAKACDKALFKETVEGNSRQLLIITICTSIATTIIATLIVVSVGMIFITNHCSFKDSKCIAKLESHHPAIFALTVVSIFSNVYMFCLSWTAMSAWEQNHSNALVSDLIDFDDINYINRSSIGLLVVFNTISLFSSIIIFGLVAGLICFKENNYELIKKLRMLRLVSVLCAGLSVGAHSPYIAIAYLNNEYHATGIFIYYSLLGCLLFGLSWIAFHYYYHDNSTDSDNTCGPNDITRKRCYNSMINFFKHKFVIIVALFFIIFITLAFIVILTCFFIIIPINKSISEFPNRIMGIYMSGGFVISTFFVYKLVVYLCRKNRHHSVSECDNQESVERKSTKKLKKMWRVRSDSEKKCVEYIALERIKDGIQNLTASLNKDAVIVSKEGDQTNSDAQHEDAQLEDVCDNMKPDWRSNTV